MDQSIELSEIEEQNQSSFLSLQAVTTIINSNTHSSVYSHRQTQMITQSLKISAIFDSIKRKRLSYPFQLFKQFILFSDTQSGSSEKPYRYSIFQLNSAVQKIDDYYSLNYKIVVGKAFQDIKALSRKRLFYQNQLNIDELCVKAQQCLGQVRILSLKEGVQNILRAFQYLDQLKKAQKDKSRKYSQEMKIDLIDEFEHRIKTEGLHHDSSVELNQVSRQKNRFDLKTKRKASKQQNLQLLEQFDSEYQSSLGYGVSAELTQKQFDSSYKMPSFNSQLYDIERDLNRNSTFLKKNSRRKQMKENMKEKKEQYAKDHDQSSTFRQEYSKKYYIKKLVIVNNYEAQKKKTSNHSFRKNLKSSYARDKDPLTFRKSQYNVSHHSSSLNCINCKYCHFMKEVESFKREKLLRFS